MPTAAAPPARSSQSANVSPASRSPANCPTTRTTASDAVLAGQLRGLLAELDLHVADVAAEQHLVAGRGPAVGAALEAEEADVGDVVLAARVGAAGDVDAHAADLGEAGLLERVADVGGEAARLRDREVAGVGAGARHDVAGELGAGLGHVERDEPLVAASASWSSVRPRSTKFWRLVMRTSTPKSRWMSARPRNWSVVMSPRRQ